MAKELPKGVKEAIKDLKFKTNQAIEDRETKKKSYVPAVRQMTEDDVLSWKYVGQTLVIVSKDGTKHRIEGVEPDKDEKKDEKK